MMRRFPFVAVLLIVSLSFWPNPSIARQRSAIKLTPTEMLVPGASLLLPDLRWSSTTVSASTAC